MALSLPTGLSPTARDSEPPCRGQGSVQGDGDSCPCGLVCWATLTRYHGMELKQQEITVSQSWRLEVRGQGVWREWFFLRPLLGL